MTRFKLITFVVLIFASAASAKEIRYLSRSPYSLNHACAMI